jgi:hypothetical protein
MKQLIFLIALFFGLAARNGLGQNVNIHQAAHVDTAAGAPLKTNFPNGSLPIDGKRLLSLWLGSGNAGQGVWLGTNGNHALYFFADSSKAGITLHPSGKVEFGNSIHINGTTTTKILTVTGGVNPGLTLQQEGMFGEGPMVTLTGRVYALATVANGPIRPGDLLTTSRFPAMR